MFSVKNDSHIICGVTSGLWRSCFKSDNEWSDVEEDADGEPVRTEPADAPPHQPHSPQQMVRADKEHRSKSHKKASIRNMSCSKLRVSPDSKRQQRLEATIARLENIYRRGRAEGS
jgi:hypothetical protein